MSNHQTGQSSKETKPGVSKTIDWEVMQKVQEPKSLIELVSNWNSQADRNPEERSLSQNQAVRDEIKIQNLRSI